MQQLSASSSALATPSSTLSSITGLLRGYPAGALTMTSRNVLLHSLLPGLFALVCCGSTFAGENSPAPWDKAGCTVHRPARRTWFKFGGAHCGEGPTTTSCVSCHTLLPFALARPVLRRVSNESQPTKLETTILEQVKRRVANWDQLEEPEYQLYYDFDDDKKKQSRGTESILNALVLSFDDRLAGRQEPNADTKKALANLWSTQITEGEHKGSWEWLNFGTQPWESKDSRYLGAVLAAIAVGTASGNVAVSAQGDSQDRIGSLRSYLTKNLSSQNLHNRVWLLWAEATMKSLLSSQEKEKLIEQILAKQLSSGGWSLGSLGGFAQGRDGPGRHGRRLCDRVDPARFTDCRPAEGQSPGEQGPGLAAVESRSNGCLAGHVAQQESRTRVKGPGQSPHRQIHVGRRDELRGPGALRLTRHAKRSNSR